MVVGGLVMPSRLFSSASVLVLFLPAVVFPFSTFPGALVELGLRVAAVQRRPSSYLEISPAA
jgi:hypothetical protein